MTTANTLTPKEIAALLVIGDKILSGRTKDKNIGYIAEYLTALGIDLREVRVVGDEETAIVDALNALRHRYTYVFTTGGIGPAHDDITSDCVAKAFGLPIDVDPRALAILHDWLKATGAEMTEARMRMTRIPKGADLVLNEVSGAPGSAAVLSLFCHSRGRREPVTTDIDGSSFERAVILLGGAADEYLGAGLEFALVTGNEGHDHRLWCDDDLLVSPRRVPLPAPLTARQENTVITARSCLLTSMAT